MKRVFTVPDPENQNREQRRLLFRRLLAGFFSAMLVFTILSRAIDSYEVPKVQTEYCTRGSVVKTIEGTGSVEAGETRTLRLVKGLTVGKLEVSLGAKTAEGDVLFYYEKSSLLERKRELEREIKKLELEIAQEDLGSESCEGASRASVEALTLSIARRALERQYEKLVKARTEYEENMASLKNYYEKRIKLSEEELNNQSRDDFDESRNHYETAQMERDSELKEIRRKIKATEKKIEKLEKKEDPSEEELDALSEELEQYEEELDDASDRWALKLDQAEEELDHKKDIYDRAGKEADSARLALTENYEAAVKQEKKALESAEDERVQAEWNLESAAAAYENAIKEDHASRLTREQGRKLAAMRNEARRLDLEEKKEKLEEISGLISQNGAVRAPCDGAAAVCELEPGRVIQGPERLMLSTGELLFKGKFDREEEESLRPGDQLQLKLESGGPAVSAFVEQVDLVSSETEGTFTSGLEALNASLGEKGSFECKRKSEDYGCVIPVKALRKDIKGDYCLAARKQRTILGEEYRAARVDVKVLLRGDAVAAVEGAFSEEEPVITGSDRVIGVGTRIRPLAYLSNQP